MTAPTETDFPVAWADPAHAERCWRYDRVHVPGAVSLLGFELGIGPFVAGFGWGGAPIQVNYYCFFDYSSGPDDSAPPPPSTPDELRARARAWDDEILPEVIEHTERYRTTDFDAMPDAELADELEKLRALRFRSGRLHTRAIMPHWFGMNKLIETYKKLTGGEDLGAMRLVAGLGNKSLEAGQRLWDVSRVAAGIPAVRERLLAIDAANARDTFAALESQPDARPFVDAFRSYLDEFGWRSGGEFAATTWYEDPTVPLTLLRPYLETDGYDPYAEQARLAADREAAIAETMAAIEESEREAFADVVDAAQAVAKLCEDHNYFLDQRLYSMPRRLALAAGRRLAATGALERAGDIFHLHLAEAKDALAGAAPDGLAATAARRKEELEHWRTVEPPDYIGAPPPGEAPEQPPAAADAARDSELKGMGVSAGVARGPARIVPSLTDSDRLRPGDILVTSVTQPPWTPLFGVARAVVTEVGGMLSHTSVAAREFGIPAVVAVPDAMRRLQDGQLVEVDGAAGTITVVG